MIKAEKQLYYIVHIFQAIRVHLIQIKRQKHAWNQKVPNFFICLTICLKFCLYDIIFLALKLSSYRRLQTIPIEHVCKLYQ